MDVVQTPQSTVDPVDVATCLVFLQLLQAQTLGPQQKKVGKNKKMQMQDNDSNVSNSKVPVVGNSLYLQALLLDRKIKYCIKTSRYAVISILWCWRSAGGSISAVTTINKPPSLEEFSQGIASLHLRFGGILGTLSNKVC